MGEEYRSNSHRSKELQAEPEKKIEKVVTGGVKQRKQSGLSKVVRTFLPGDMDSVKTYILMDVLIPSIRRAISDAICNGISILFGEPSRNKSNVSGSRVSYRSCYRDPEERRDYARPRAQAQFSYDDIVFDNYGDAEIVLDRMRELLDHFEVVSVADLFDLAGIASDYTNNKYGWTDLNDAKIKRVSDGYILALPRATSL